MALAPGALVAGKYRVESLLGEGGMGAVYVAVNERLHKRVALKVLGDPIAAIPGASERFVREAIAASQAKHPGIVEIHDADVHEGMPWIAMELLEGESLRQRMTRGPMRAPEAVDVVLDALSAIAAVHDVGVVHRDLKPDNLFLERLPHDARRVKVLDFGVAKVAVDGMDRMTKSGTAMGTPEYLAPEQATGAKHVDHRADVYAMGVILFELVTGRLPYDAESFGQLVALMVTKGPMRVADANAAVPPALAALIDRCIAVEPDHRPATIRRMAEALARIRDSGDLVGQVAATHGDGPAGAVALGVAATTPAEAAAWQAPPPAGEAGATTARAGGQTPHAQGWFSGPGPGAAGSGDAPSGGSVAPRPPTPARPGALLLGAAVLLLALAAGAATVAVVVVRSSGDTVTVQDVVAPPSPEVPRVVAPPPSPIEEVEPTPTTTPAIPPRAPRAVDGSRAAPPAPPDVTTEIDRALRASQEDVATEVQRAERTLEHTGDLMERLRQASRPPAPSPETRGARPSREAVAAALRAAAPGVRPCFPPGARGIARAQVTFEGRTGAVTACSLDGPFPADQRECACRQVRRAARVPPFAEPTFTLQYPFRLR